MIKTLQIQNFALVNTVEINFQSGFNVLFGETGAGKSIILKSIYYLLGAKFNKTDVRSGEKFVKVSATFDASAKTREALQKLGLNPNDEVLISRYTELPARNECRINGEIVSLDMLAEVAETLLDFYGQHENMLLLKTSNHLKILDDFSPSTTAQTRHEVYELYTQYNQIKAQIDGLGGSEAERARKLDLLDYQINEIENANLAPNEDIELEEKLYNAKNHEKICEVIYSALDKIGRGSAVLDNLNHATKILSKYSEIDPTANEYIEKLDNCFFEIENIAEILENDINKYDYSQAQIEEMFLRADAIKTLKKKYGHTIEEIMTFQTDAIKQREALLGAEETLAALKTELAKVEDELKSKSLHLSTLRKENAQGFEKGINTELAELGMKNARICVNFKTTSTYTQSGIDNVEFLFSANLGQDLKPLSKTISGGEMSRLMLAIKLITADQDAVGTLIFDEIDAGISGEIGSAIAKKIAKIARKYQVICISHLPQVCAMADAFFYVSKNVTGGKTQSKVEILKSPQIEEAIAKLSGGKFDTETSIAHAVELMTWAKEWKAINSASLPNRRK